ncbi:hypothetical protein [Dyadobacter sp. CY326]|uniref:hypothetical protein n=1 Tax=Dyadobacter sp. CY326 TaxID=2907300 RepID=UPI001F468980|nr:hypothetical protein [Dyadobacter sp. CY326]MCE7064066.1 hypothetical protein [Dyadobacter sp. CY326]
MKTFKFKDLAVTVDINQDKPVYCFIRYASRLKDEIELCRFHTCYHFSIPITVCHKACSIVYSFTHDPIEITDWKNTTPVQQVVDDFDVSELTEFKNNLAELQKYVDVKIQEAPNELDMLERKLNEAIEEVRAQRGKQ